MEERVGVAVRTTLRASKYTAAARGMAGNAKEAAILAAINDKIDSEETRNTSYA